MGHNIKMLMEKRAEKGMDENHTARLELEECIHFHMDDFRFVFTVSEFLRLVELFKGAGQTLADYGNPESSEHMILLQGMFLDNKCMHNDRLAVEVTKDGSIHMHIKNLRTHMTAMDYYEFADGIRETIPELCRHLQTTINLEDPNLIFPSISDRYVEALKEYDEGKHPEVSADEAAGLKVRMRWYERHPKGDSTVESDLQRPSGHLPSPWPGVVPEDLSFRYLFALYESIMEWGYAAGPYEDDLMPAYKYPNGKIYLKGAHRAAVLRHINSEIGPVKVILAAAPTGWATE